MAFKNINLKVAYDSDEDNILDNFYIPLLSNAVRYDRLAGYFSSASFAMSAKGMVQFLKNKGKMRLVTSVRIPKADQDAIREGLTNPDEVIARLMQEKLESANHLQQNHTSVLAWLIAKQRLEIKIAVPLEKDDALSVADGHLHSIYHQKVGILYDVNGDIVSFSGSINETGKAWSDNIEEFKVFCSWKVGQDVYGANDSKKFEKFWYGKAHNTCVYDLPTAIKDMLIRDAPETEADAVNLLLSKAPKQYKLREYQKEAIQEWCRNGMSGILEMATGTGKTATSIYCIKEALNLSDNASTLVVISCPFIHLVSQWAKELDKHGIDAQQVYGSSSSWIKDLNSSILYLGAGIIKQLVLITTHDTFSNTVFIGAVKLCRANSMVVIDEVHKIGAAKMSHGLLAEYKHRLGLSATPSRHFDEEGTKRIMDYFGGVIYKFGLDDAIKNKYLTNYHLFPHLVYMNSDELDDYRKYSKKIAIANAKDPPDLKLRDNLLLQRANILKTANNKLNKFREILSDNPNLSHCLVYCANGAQLNDAASILHEMGIIFHRFTYHETKDERVTLLEEFAKGEKNVLLAIKCLDEGIDIPSTEIAIILASSGNPVEFIQRRGRILRPYHNKKSAVIHDLIVTPEPSSTEGPYMESEKTIIRNELARIEEFASSSNNPEVSNAIIQNFVGKCGL